MFRKKRQRYILNISFVFSIFICDKCCELRRIHLSSFCLFVQEMFGAADMNKMGTVIGKEAIVVSDEKAGGATGPLVYPGVVSTRITVNVLHLVM